MAEHIATDNPSLHAETPCPNCQRPINAASCMDKQGVVVPKPGDPTICGYCGEKLVYCEGSTLRKMTPQDFAKLSPRDQHMMGQLSETIRNSYLITIRHQGTAAQMLDEHRGTGKRFENPFRAAMFRNRGIDTNQ